MYKIWYIFFQVKPKIYTWPFVFGILCQWRKVFVPSWFVVGAQYKAPMVFNCENCYMFHLIPCVIFSLPISIAPYMWVGVLYNIININLGLPTSLKVIGWVVNFESLWNPWKTWCNASMINTWTFGALFHKGERKHF